MMNGLNVLGHDQDICDKHKEKRYHREAAQGIEEKYIAHRGGQHGQQVVK